MSAQPQRSDPPCTGEKDCRVHPGVKADGEWTSRCAGVVTGGFGKEPAQACRA